MYIMKNNITRSLFAACAILAAISCANEINEPIQNPSAPEQTPGASDLVFTAANEGVVITKTSLSSNLIPEWVSGDAIGITSETDNNVECKLISAEEGKFSGEHVTGQAPYYAVYPYDENNTFSGSTLTASVPSVQTVAAGQRVALGALVAVCESASTELSFMNCVSLMQVNIPRNDIKQVTIESTKEDEYLCGRFTIDLSAEILAPEVVEGVTSVTLVPAGDALEAGTYYIAVLPTTISGVKITFTNTKDESISVTKEASTTLARSNGVNFGTFFVYEINTPEDLYSWAKSEGKYTAWDVVNLNADLDMSKFAAEYIEAVNFEGTFNGNNKTISGLTTPLFANLYGSVNNLTLNSNITYKGRTTNMPGHNQVVGILAHIAYNSKHEDAKISNVTTKGSITVEMGDFDKYFGVAGLVGSCNGVVIENCENQAAVEVKSLSLVVAEDGDAKTAGNTNRILAAGIVAQTKENTTKVNNCKNVGSIKICEGVSTISQSIAGGVAAYTDGNVTYTGCSNTGNVTNSAGSAKIYFTGGVLGTLGILGDTNGVSSAAWKSTFNGCKNSGSVIDDSQYSTAVDHYVGGLIAFACVNGVTLGESQNSGTVQLTCGCSKIACIGGAIGRFHQYRLSTLNNLTNESTGIVTIQSESASIYAGGIVGHKSSSTSGNTDAAKNQPAIILNSDNNANIINNGTASTDIRIGGIAGYLHYGATIGANDGDVYSAGCVNTGSITSSSAQTAPARIGGIVGQSGNSGVNIYDSTNTGDISFDSTVSAGDLYVGGIGAYLGSAPVVIGCTSNCNISKNGTVANPNAASIMGYSGASVTVVKNCKLRGSVFGVDVDAENLVSNLCASFKSTSPTKTFENNSLL